MKLEGVVMILDLHRQGLSVSAIARQAGVDRKTVRRTIERGLEPPAYGPRQAVARMVAVELAGCLLIQLGLFERHQLALGQHAALLGDLDLQGFQPLLHGLQVVAHPDAADPERRDLGAALLQFVGSPRLAPGRLLDGHRDHGGFHLGRGTVLQVGLGQGDLGQRQIAAFLVKVSKAVETVAAV